jgi:hypothetical protein
MSGTGTGRAWDDRDPREFISDGQIEIRSTGEYVGQPDIVRLIDDSNVSDHGTWTAATGHVWNSDSRQDEAAQQRELEAARARAASDWSAARPGDYSRYAPEREEQPATAAASFADVLDDSEAWDGEI